MLDVNGNDVLREILCWHYRHGIINSWGGTWLVSLTRELHIAEDEMVAQSPDSEDSSVQASPSSSASLWINPILRRFCY